MWALYATMIHGTLQPLSTPRRLSSASTPGIDADGVVLGVDTGEPAAPDTVAPLAGSRSTAERDVTRP